MVEDSMALHLGRDCDNDYGDGDDGDRRHDNDNDVWT